MEIRNANDARAYIAAWAGKSCARSYLALAAESQRACSVVAAIQRDKSGERDHIAAAMVLDAALV